MNNPSVYLLLGPEAGKRNVFIDKIRKALVVDNNPPEEYRFYSFETPIRNIVSLLQNGSLFASRKLVIYHGAEDISRKDDIALLSGYIKKPSPEGVLLLVSDKMSVEKKISDCVGPAGTQKFWELFDNEKAGWVVNCFRRRNARISTEAVNVFLELVENNTQEFERECGNLCAFLGENAEVTVQDIENHLYHGKAETVYSLFEAVCSLDFERTLDVLNKLLLEGNAPVQILIVLVREFRKLYSYRQLLDKNFSAEEAFSRLRIIIKRSQKVYAIGAKNFSADELENIIIFGTDCDEELRSGSAEMHTRLIEMFLYCAIVNKGENAMDIARR